MFVVALHYICVSADLHVRLFEPYFNTLVPIPLTIIENTCALSPENSLFVYAKFDLKFNTNSHNYGFSKECYTRQNLF